MFSPVLRTTPGGEMTNPTASPGRQVRLNGQAKPYSVHLMDQPGGVATRDLHRRVHRPRNRCGRPDTHYALDDWSADRPPSQCACAITRSHCGVLLQSRRVAPSLTAARVLITGKRREPPSRRLRPRPSFCLYSSGCDHLWCFSTPYPAWGPAHPEQGMCPGEAHTNRGEQSTCMRGELRWHVSQRAPWQPL